MTSVNDFVEVHLKHRCMLSVTAPPTKPTLILQCCYMHCIITNNSNIHST